MPRVSTSFTVRYMAYNVETGEPVTGDSENHTIKYIVSGSDNTVNSFTGTITQVDSTNCPGLYAFTIGDAFFTTCGIATIYVKSSTSGVIIPPIQIPIENYSVASDIPTPLEVATGVWGHDTRIPQDVNSYGESLKTKSNIIANIGAISDAVWDENLSEHITTGTMGKKLNDMSTGGGGSITAADVWNYSGALTAESIADAVWDEPVSEHNTAAGTFGIYAYDTAYSMSTVGFRVWSFDLNQAAYSNWGDTTAGMKVRTIASIHDISDKIWDEIASDHIGPGTTGEKLNSIGAGGTLTAQEVWEYAGGRTITNNIPTVAQISDQVWNELLSEHISSGSTGAKLDELQNSNGETLTAQAVWNYSGGRTITSNIPTAETIADAVWDESGVDHSVANSMGSKLNVLSSNLVSNIWNYSNRTITGMNAWSISTIQSGLAKTTDLTNLAKTTDVTGLYIPTAETIADTVWNENLSEHTDTGTTGKKLNDVQNSSGSGGSNLTAQEVWEYAGGRTITNNIPTVSQIQSGLAKTSDIPDISGLATSEQISNLNIPTVAQIQTGIAKTSEIQALNNLSTGDIGTALITYGTAKTTDLNNLATSAEISALEIPTVQEIQTGLAKTTELPDISGLAKITDIPTDYAKTSDIPTASTIANNVWEYNNKSLDASVNLSLNDLCRIVTMTNMVDRDYLSNLCTTMLGFTTQDFEEAYSISPHAKLMSLNNSSGGATAQEVWEYAGGRTITNNIPTVAQISDQVWNESLSDHITSGSTGAKLNNMNSGSGGSISAADVWAYSERTLTSGGTSGITIADVETALDNYGTAKTSDIPTVSTIQNGLAKTIDIESLNIPTVAQIQSGIAKSSELPTVPTVAQIATGVWSNATRTITSGGITVNDVQTALTSYGAAKYTDLPDVPTVSQIQNGLATVNDIPTVTEIQSGLAKTSDISNLEIPTVEEIQNGLAKTAEILALNDISIGEIGTALTTYNAAKRTDIPSIASVQNGLAKTSDIVNLDIPTVEQIQTGLAKTSELPTVPTAGDIADQVWNESLSEHVTNGTSGKKLNDMNSGSGGSISAADVWGYSERTLTSGGTSGISTADITTALNTYGAAKTTDIPTVIQIQNGLAKTSDIPTVPTVLEIQNGLAKTSDIVNLEIPTVLEIQSGLAKSSELPNISGLATSAQISALNIPTVAEIQTGLAKSSELPTVPTVAQIQNGLAKSSELPTVADIQSGLAKTSDIPSVPTLSEISEEVWGAETRTLTSGGTSGGGVTISDITTALNNYGAAKTSDIAGLDIPTISQISEEVWAADNRTLSSGITGGSGITIADVETALDNYGTAKTSDIPTIAQISEEIWTADVRTLTNGNGSIINSFNSINTMEATKAAIESQYIGLADVYTYESTTDLDNITSTTETTAYTNIRCRLSFTTTDPVGQGNVADIVQTVKLFTCPEYTIPAGSKITVTQNGRTNSYRCSSVPNVYTTHQEIDLIPWEDYA